MDLRRLREPARYALVLQVFDAFLAAWEPAVAAALPPRWQPWLRARSRRPFLRQDMRLLAIGRWPSRIPAPAFHSPAAAWGSVYVIEGSALGGPSITRSLADAGLHPARGCAYFHGWGEATGAMWREFRALLEAQLAGPDAVAQACDAACRTFDLLAGSLEPVLHERASAA